MVKCNQVCPWNYYEIGCKKPNDELCPMSNLATKEKPQTNADRIRAMSDEELAHELALIAGWDRKQYEKAKRIGIENVMLDWLRKEQGEHHEVD